LVKQRLDPDRLLEQLTEKQRDVLDRVIVGDTSKEIARVLGISPHTVDQRVASARRTLGVASRRDLARTYGRLKRIYDEDIYQSLPIDDHPEQPHGQPEDRADRQNQSEHPISIKRHWRGLDGLGQCSVTEMRDRFGDDPLKIFEAFGVAFLVAFFAWNFYAAVRSIMDLARPFIG
jgi:DNA-binding CsgD family transcriptional regulator